MNYRYCLYINLFTYWSIHTLPLDLILYYFELQWIMYYNELVLNEVNMKITIKKFNAQVDGDSQRKIPLQGL